MTATGAAGIDWANVENPTTALNLSGTNIDVDQVVASVTGVTDWGVANAVVSEASVALVVLAAASGNAGASPPTRAASGTATPVLATVR